MRTLKSILFLPILWLESLSIFIIFLPVFFLPSKIAYWMPVAWTWTVRLSLRFVGIKIKVEGLENLPKKQGYIVASKHQSAMETLLFHTMVPNVFYIFKRSLLWLPLAGLYALKTGCIPIDRAGGAKTMRIMLKRAQGKLSQGRNLIIFPEGTRTKPGEKIDYHPGIAFLYDNCKVPVVPVALNTGVFWPKNKIMKYPGTVIVRFLPPIEPGMEKRAFLNKLQNEIEKEQETLQSEWNQ
jgi:1-acyl-sn-glycerol-3-phosphate acyltransferase